MFSMLNSKKTNLLHSIASRYYFHSETKKNIVISYSIHDSPHLGTAWAFFYSNHLETLPNSLGPSSSVSCTNGKLRPNFQSSGHGRKHSPIWQVN